VQAGEHFGLVITEGPADMARLKGDLERDLLRKNTILQETPDLLIFRSEFPDDTTLTFHRFHRSVAFRGSHLQRARCRERHGLQSGGRATHDRRRAAPAGGVALVPTRKDLGITIATQAFRSA
jgi:hypothetical protein